MGTASGAEGPPRKSQHVLGAPWSPGHQPLLGHQHPPSVCGRLWRQSVMSTCRIFQSRQGSACTPGVKKPMNVQILDNCIFVWLCPGPIRYLPCSDRHHGGLQGGSDWLPRWPPVSVFLESLLPLRHREVSPAKCLQGGTSLRLFLLFFIHECVCFLAFREKFWRIGNKERDGEYGACFFPQSRGMLQGQPALLYCARPGSRIWEVNFSGEVLSTHQFKQLLACPPLPLITHRYRRSPPFNTFLRKGNV